jgi:chaperonin GroEL (HSP60 family)
MNGAILETYAYIEILKSYWHNGLEPNIYFYRDNDQKEIIIPERIGNFAPKTEIIHVPVEKTIFKPKWYKDTKTEKELKKEIEEQNERIKVYDEEIEWMKEEFAYMDSIQKAEAFSNAIKLNKFSTEFEDDYLKLNIQGIVRGEVKEITPIYLIKEQKISIPSEKIKLLVGAGIGSNFELNQFTYKFNIGVQNKKQNIYRASYQRIGNQNFGVLEYDINLIK